MKNRGKKKMYRARDRGLKEGAELRKRERVENDVVSKMKRAMLEKGTVKCLKTG